MGKKPRYIKGPGAAWSVVEWSRISLGSSPAFGTIPPETRMAPWFFDPLPRLCNSFDNVWPILPTPRHVLSVRWRRSDSFAEGANAS